MRKRKRSSRPASSTFVCGIDTIKIKIGESGSGSAEAEAVKAALKSTASASLVLRASEKTYHRLPTIVDFNGFGQDLKLLRIAPCSLVFNDFGQVSTSFFSALCLFALFGHLFCLNSLTTMVALTHGLSLHYRL